MKYIFAALILCFASGAAVLPPVWQGVTEIKAILNSQALDQYLDSGDILESIARHEDGWLITTSRSQVYVKVAPEPQNRPGPQRFHLEFSSQVRP
jgi:hypothetical protein